MEKYFIPANKIKFIIWLLRTSIDNDWTNVFEYSNECAYNFLKEIGTEVSLPTTSKHEYSSESKLTAIVKPLLNDNSINQLMAMTHVLSIHNEKEMMFLIADDFDDECFSSSVDFFTKYYQTIINNHLADIAR
jgi:hypothetical protein